MEITSDQGTYKVGETAEIKVSVDWGDDGSGSMDPWAHVVLYDLDGDGVPGRADEYPDFGLHDGEPSGRIDWSRLAIAITNDMWGQHRVEALIYEPERYEYGRVSVDFTVEKPGGEGRTSRRASNGHEAHQSLPLYQPPSS
jgi:hypothetical protein